MLLFVECLFGHSYAKERENEIYMCGWPREGIFSRGKAPTGIVDRLGTGHQSRNSCEQCWCKLGAEKGSCEQSSAPPSPPPTPPPPLKMCHLNKLTSEGPSWLELLRDRERAAECRD